MDGSPTETLEGTSTKQPCTLPPHRRRPLRSTTLDSLLLILSRCYHHDKSQRHRADSEALNKDSGHIELAPANTSDGSLSSIATPSIEFPLQKENFLDRNRNLFGTQKSNLSNAFSEFKGSDQSAIGFSKEIAHEGGNGFVDSFGTESQNFNGTAALTSELQPQINVSELQMKYFDEQNDLVPELPILMASNKTGTSIHLNKVVQTSNPSENGDEERARALNKNDYEEVKDRLELDMIDSSAHLVNHEEIEEGELSEGFMDALRDDSKSFKADKVIEVDFFEAMTGKEQQIGVVKDTKSVPFSTDIIDCVKKHLKAETTENRRILVDYSEIVEGSNVETGQRDQHCCEGNSAIWKNTATKQVVLTVKKDSCAVNQKKRKNPSRKEKRANKKVCSLQVQSEMVVNEQSAEHVGECNIRIEKGTNKMPGNVAESGLPTICPSAALAGENSSQMEVMPLNGKEDGIVVEKRKKRVLTKEGREKKKKKERIRRAEKNRKLGVRRLKLQPVLKEKKISYCRHYLKGRCQEGENCKFSHDTTPLTKSKPCCHFARHSCMKGDDCPYDHQLSRYPCNNYQSKGYCSRGSDCMFSHEMQGSEVPLSGSADPVAEPKSLPVSNSSSSKTLSKIHNLTHAKVDSIFTRVTISPSKATAPNLPNTTPKPSVRPPKGVSFLNSTLSFGKKTSSDDFSSRPEEGDGAGKTPSISKGEESGLFLDRENGTKLYSQIGSSVDQNLMAKGVPHVVPRGINFLSFGKKPSGSSLSATSCEKSVTPMESKDTIKVDKMVSQISSLVEKEDDRDFISRITNWVPALSPANAQSLGLSADGPALSVAGPSRKPILPLGPSSLQKSLQSTLAFASKFESEVKIGRSVGAPGFQIPGGAQAAGGDLNKGGGPGSSQSMKAPAVADFLYRYGSRAKQ